MKLELVARKGVDIALVIRLRASYCYQMNWSTIRKHNQPGQNFNTEFYKYLNCEYSALEHGDAEANYHRTIFRNVGHLRWLLYRCQVLNWIQELREDRGPTNTEARADKLMLSEYQNIATGKLKIILPSAWLGSASSQEQSTGNFALFKRAFNFCKYWYN